MLFAKSFCLNILMVVSCERIKEMSSCQTLLALLTLQIFCIHVTLCRNKKAIYKNIEEDITRLKANKVKCTKAGLDNVLRLKCEGRLDKAMLCIGEKLLANNDQGELWTHLGEIYHRQGKRTKGNKCLKEASRIDGEFTGQITLWHFIGPFQIGKAEIDGDPLEAFGGIGKILCQRYGKDFQAYSELAPRGIVRWSTIEPAKDRVTVESKLDDWDTLVFHLDSSAVLEWQGWLVGDFRLNSEMTILIRCDGVSTVYVDETMLAGDVYVNVNYWYPVHLKPGFHAVLLRIRETGNMSFYCKLKPADKSPPFNIHPVITPDLVDGRIFSNHVSIPVTNHHPSKWLTITKLTVESQNGGPNVALHLDQTQSLTVAPGQIRPIIATLIFESTKLDPTSCPAKDIEGLLQLKSSDGSKVQSRFTIRCRSRSEPIFFTFIDHDGSVQRAATIFPIVDDERFTSRTYPVLLTLHGTGSTAQTHAEAYKRKESGKDRWIFGVEGVWVLAPSRHGDHNWEGPGELTAMTSLQKLAELTRKHDWINTKVNSKAVVFAGHAMGGHGAWQLSSHHPDITLAVISIAGWTSKQNYRQWNTFFKVDISESHTDASLKHILESCIAENDAGKLVSNLKGIPIMIRAGAKDEIVHPYFSRRMFRLLKEQGNAVTYHELPDKTHWWWDTYSKNDGGAVNDRDMREFLVNHSKFAITKTFRPACSRNEQGISCEDEGTSIYSSRIVPNRNLVSSGEFILTLFNPASSHGVRGVKVLQQATPFRKSTVRMHFTGSNVTIFTSNVIRLRFTEPAISPVRWTERGVLVDGVQISVDRKNGNVYDLCKDGKRHWGVCEVFGECFESEKQRGPLNHGPAGRIAERPLLIIVGTSRKSQTAQALLQMAVYIASTFYLTSHTTVPIIQAKDLDNEDIRNHNLIIIGELSFSAFYLEKIPLMFDRDSSIHLGNCVFQSSDMGVLSLVPHSGSRLALVITGTTLSAIRDVVSLATPTVPPMARSPFSNLVPDYVITGPDFRARGPGGYLCAGFWGNSWEYRSDISSCAC